MLWYSGTVKRANEEAAHRSLAEKYALMSDGELLEIAATYDDLTVTARIGLNAEMDRRGLRMPAPEYPQPKSAPPVDDADDEPVTVGLYRDLPEALLAKGRLESAGMECFLADDNMVRLDWFLSNAIGNMRLQVREKDAEEARELLTKPVTEAEPPEENS
jgi:hypothetical protein